MSGTGGSRPGAGRPPKAEKFAGTIAKSERKIADRLPSIIDRMFELADGVVVAEAGKDGEVRVYTRPPDFKAGAYLIDRILGKPRVATDPEDSQAGLHVHITDAAFAERLAKIYGPEPSP
ncbi:hypothetical protein EP7_005653 (plasmid) [Isosphaeraceae bacterium EP7]